MTKRTQKNPRSHVRLGPRMSRGIYQLAKYVYGMKGVNLEDQIEELIDRDLDYQMKQKWFLNATAGKEEQNFERLKKVLDDSKGTLSGSDFYANDVNNVGGNNE
jgi:hypothetical protein